MKAVLSFFALLFCLLLAACGGGEEVTAVPTPVLEVVETETAVQPKTDTLASPTETPLPANTLTTSPTQTARPNPTETTVIPPMLVPTLINTAQPTFVPPNIEGTLFFFWDKETPLEEPTYYSIPLYDPKQDLYMAMPDNGLPENWETSPILNVWCELDLK